MVVTDALIIRLAKMPAKDQKQMMDDNPNANYALMIVKCDELSARMDTEKKWELAQQIEDLKFMAGLYQVKQRTVPGTVEIDAYERSSL